ncbi:MAG: class I SAM-dependent rRNA methyltransferase [Candidatus Omnitrophica bacterium]|nr:class I SAM-dependent rRNA methyltransferase [Candidatus Omnitrophota bacterium]
MKGEKQPRPQRVAYPPVSLRPGREIPVRAGHPWIFSQAISRPANAPPGALVAVYSAVGDFLGIGMWNPATTIRVRMIRGLEAAPAPDFFFERFRELDALKRCAIAPDTTGYRAVQADADGLPGLIVDRYESAIVFQIHTAGMDRLRREIVDGLLRFYQPALLVERSDVAARSREGLSDAPVIVHRGDAARSVFFRERGVRFVADVVSGQKTGFYLDQRDTRCYAASLSSGKRILNLFCYSAAASVFAALAGARRIVSVDSSAPALALAERNFRENGIRVSDDRRVLLACEDVFEFLRRARRQGDVFDLVICDPPAFAKSQQSVPAALEAYARLNESCLRVLRRGGILISSSCSGRIGWTDFFDALRIAAGSAGRRARILARWAQPVDHTDAVAFPEGGYLKNVAMEIIGIANNDDAAVEEAPDTLCTGGR